MRDLLLVTVFGALLPLCFVRPYVGVLVWSWIGYMNPHRLTFGFTYGGPFAQVAAIVTVLGLLFTKDRSPLPRSAETYLLLALSFVFFLSTCFAIYPEEAWAQFNKVWKILFMTFVTLLLFQDRKKLRLLLLVITLSIGFFGLRGGIWAVLTGGQYHVLGPPASFLEGNTNIGMALAMVLPFLFFLAPEENRLWLRVLLRCMFFFSIIAVLVTYSRGAFLALAVVLSLILLKSRAKVTAVLLLAISIPIAFSVLPEKWFGRMETIQTYEEDLSAMSRLTVWGISYRLALDHPILGGGFEPFSVEIYRRYLPTELQKDAILGTGAHSIFFQVLAEHGFTGLFLYVALIVSTLLSVRRMIHRSKRDPSMTWIYNYSQMVQISLAGFLVSGTFLSMCYFDLFYHLVGVVIILKRLLVLEGREVIHAPHLTKAETAFPLRPVSASQPTT